ncbi:MAG: YqaJ viral recombinase family protein [Alcanivorax sp.]
MSTPRAIKPSSRPALRLVSTKGMNREQWLKVRKQGIGASDAAAAVGLNPYQSPLELWMIKTCRDGLLPAPDPDDIHTPLYWGNLLEPKVAEAYAKATGNKVRRVNAVLQHPDDDKPWMLANLDYAIVGNDNVQILECKTTGQYGAKLWADGVPEYIQCQVQHQLAVTGKQAADVAVLICGQELQIHRIKRDEALIAHLYELEREFWQLVEADTPPDPDGSGSAGQALQALYPRDQGGTINLADNPAMEGDFNELLDLRDTLSRLTERESTLKQRIQQSMGLASKATFTEGSVTWKRSKDSTSLDTKALLRDQPELLQHYPKHKAGSRRFLVRSNP